jgi:pimeloyl-ACP methyl ester carboxylesterase
VEYFCQAEEQRMGTSGTDWSFGGQWPHEPRFVDTPDGRLHDVDEGDPSGRPVVLLHGNPTWGFLYRHFIPPLVNAGFRAIVPDHLGFGRSDKPPDASLYRIARHVARLDSLLESLDLHEATVVPQDWGGPIGLSWAVAHPERVARLFILNTYAHRPRGKVPLPVPLRLFRAPGVGEVMVKWLNLFVRGFLFRVGVVHRDRLTAEVKRAYLAPHWSWSSRTGALVFPREIPSGPNAPLSSLLAPLEQGLETHFRNKPVKIIWAMRDPAFTPEVLDDLWLKTFPEAGVVRLENAGHYLPGRRPRADNPRAPRLPSAQLTRPAS